MTAAALQTNLAVSGDQITGILKKISDGSVWDSGTWSADESTGNYMFVKATGVPEDAVATIEVYGGSHGPTTLDSDRNVIVRITNKNTQKVVLKVKYQGVTTEKVYNLKGLTLAS